MSTHTTTLPLAITSGIEQYNGPWGWQQASHLLRRASFGPSLAEIDTAIADGMIDTVSLLLTPLALPDPPLNPSFPTDPNVPIGSTWVYSPHVAGVQQYRTRSIQAWLIKNIQESPVNVREKMVHFWNNHFGVTDGADRRVTFQYFNLYQEHAIGNFRQLVKDMTVNVAMLRFLNGNQNRAVNPNENYARELLELFTIGKGPLAGPGDYTNYTEHDVAECARILTGWQVRNVNSPVLGLQPESYFNPNRHDVTDKTLSHRFDNVVVTNADDEEYSNLIDIILGKEEVARFICRKLYRYFVYYHIDETIETNVIFPLAEVMVDNDYAIKPVLDVLFKSQHFYDVSIAGDIVKTPLSFVVGITRPTNWAANFDLALRYEAIRNLYLRIDPMGMKLLVPPSVAGWPVWYQAPSFNRLWLNNSTLQRRVNFVNEVSGQGINVSGTRYPIDWLAFIESFHNPLDPNVLVEDFALIFLPQPLYQEQLDDLKNFLIPGLPDFEWTDEYGMYLANPGDDMLRISVENKLKSLVRALFKMAEFQIN